jgi:hypothetical protein
MRRGPRFSLPEYPVWAAMVQRCTNPNDKSWERYGGRGIQVCSAWMKFDQFFAAMGQRPTAKHSLDRINNNGPYSPDNCRWATAEVQGSNKRVYRTSTTGVAGVNRRSNGTYRVLICIGGKQQTVGHYRDLSAAIDARNMAAANKPEVAA